MERQVPTIIVEDTAVVGEIHIGNENTQSDTEYSAGDGDSYELHELLRNRAITHADSGVKSFWSLQKLKEILTPERILTQLQGHNIPHQKAQAIAEQIMEGCMKIYAILTFSQMDKYITSLMDQGLVDDCLPLVAADLIGNDCKSRIARRDRPKVPLACFDEWRTTDREFFLLNQHRFNPAILEFQGETRIVQHIDFDDGTILPFTRSKHVREGGYGSVSEKNVHPDCHKFHDIMQSITIDNRFAVKKLSTEKGEKEFRNEFNALARFNGFIHTHLVTLLMTWKRREYYHFLFPLAGCDLEDFWNEHQPWDSHDTIDVPMVQWISKQVLGLTEAVNVVHNPSQHLDQNSKYGRHGDIKPENVLWYQSPQDKKGILVIADLGLLSVNTEKSRSNIPNQGIPFTPGYRPPECDLEGGTISRAYDIWTFGCLLLELVTWTLGGDSSRKSFERKRVSPYITGSKSNIFFDVKILEGSLDHVVMVKESVTEWIAFLHRQSNCTQYFHDLLDLIESGMVVILSQDQARYSSSQVLQKVQTMHQQVMEPLNRYCRDPCPEQRQPRICVPVHASLNDTAKEVIERMRPNLTVYGGKETRKAKTKDQLSNLP